MFYRIFLEFFYIIAYRPSQNIIEIESRKFTERKNPNLVQKLVLFLPEPFLRRELSLNILDDSLIKNSIEGNFRYRMC